MSSEIFMKLIITCMIREKQTLSYIQIYYKFVYTHSPIQIQCEYMSKCYVNECMYLIFLTIFCANLYLIFGFIIS